MPNNLDALEKYLKAISADISSVEIKQFGKNVGKVLVKSNSNRIGKNISPVGIKFEPRHDKEYFKPPTQARFLYPEGGTGKARLVVLTSWTIVGNVYLGYDEKRGDIRGFIRSKIIRFLPSDDAAEPISNKIKKRFKNKGALMFKKLRKQNHMQITQTPSGIELSFTAGQPDHIAHVSQYGLMDYVDRKKRKNAKDPVRELLGIGSEDIDKISEMLETLFDKV